MEEKVLVGRVSTELIEIINNLDDETLKRIPKEEIKQFESAKDNNYKFKYDHSKELKDQNIMEDTKDLFTFIYLKYCCDEASRLDIIKRVNAEKERINEKYKYENIFKNNEKEVEKKENIMPMVVEEKKSIFEKIKSYFKKIFGIK